MTQLKSRYSHDPQRGGRMAHGFGVFFQVAILAMLMVVLGSGYALAQSFELDFGLPLFGFEEIRLEKSKTPDFNISLYRKYVKENSDRVLNRLHAVLGLYRLYVMFDEPKQPELKKVMLETLKPEAETEAHRFQILDYIFLNGLLLSHDKEPDADNKKDQAFEDLLIRSDDVLSAMSEYHLVKGVLFSRLRDRPNGFFAPMKPLEDLKKAGSLASGSAHLFFALGNAFRLLGHSEQSLFQAIVAYEKAAVHDSVNPKLQNALLGIYMGLHEGYQGQKSEPFWMEEAVYKKILALSPTNPHALNNLGYLYAEYGVHRKDAVTLCQKAVDAMPNNPGFHDSLGWAAFKNQQYEKAEAELRKSVSLNPDSYDAVYHLGTLFYVRKKHEKAMEMYDKALELKPESAEVLNNYAYLLSELDRDPEKAKEMAQKAVALEPSNPSYLDTLGWVEYRLEHFEEALKYLRKAFQLAPDVGEIMMHLGRIHIELRQFERGLGYLKQALKADPALEGIHAEIFSAMNLTALHQILADYHRAFGDKVDPKNLTRVLKQIARLYQDEEQYAQANAANKVCEKLKRKELDLAKPLFDFYQIDNASGAVVLPLASGPRSAGDEAVGKGEMIATAPVFPDIAKVPLALNAGPAVFRFVSRHTTPCKDFSLFSGSLFMRDIVHPYQSMVFEIEFPDAENRNLPAAMEYYLNMYGIACRTSPPGKDGLRAMKLTYRQYQGWVVQTGDQLFFGAGEQPTPDELTLLGNTFPYDPLMVTGMVLDWPSTVKTLPRILFPFVGNPLDRFKTVYSRYWSDKGNLKEISLLVPVAAVGKQFMKDLAEELFIYKTFLLQWGLSTEITVQAEGSCVLFQIEYLKFRTFLSELRQKLGMWELVLRSYLAKYVCVARRMLFGGNIARIPASLCPVHGDISLNPSFGSLDCSIHGITLFVPVIGGSEDRCGMSRARIEGLLSRYYGKNLSPDKIEGLIKHVSMDYNISPCSRGGTYTFENGTLKCSFHSSQEQKGQTK